MKKYPVFKTIKKAIREVNKTDKIIFLNFIIYTIVASIYPLFAVFFPKIVIEELSNNSINFDYILLVIVVFTFFTGLFGFLDRLIHDINGPRLTMVRISLTTDTYEKMNNLDYKYREDPEFLDEIEDSLGAVSNNDNGFEGILGRIFRIGAKIITAIFYLVLISRLSFLVILAIVLSVLVNLIISNFVKKFRYKNKKKLAHASRKIRYYSDMTHDFSYGKDIRLYDLQERIEKSYDYEIKSYISVYKKIKNKEYFLGFIDLLFVLLSDAVLYYVLITKVLNQMSIADFSMFLVASIALSTVLKNIGEDVSFIVGEGQYVNDLYQFLETDYNEPSKGLGKVENDTLEIEFKDVSFKYPKTDKWIIKNLNLKISKKEKLAIVGINGAGKTTLVKLITRLFDPTEGSIYVNGVNIKEYDKNEYQKMFSVVFQEINILAFTIKENITLGLSDDEDRVWDSLARVGLKEKVQGFEKGLDTMMLKNIDEEGVIFSGGESQKLAIARALYHNGNAIILDEPTAALDALAEAEIYQNFNDLVEHKTAIYISHRLASTKFCDKIALFKDTSLLEYGNHDELMALGGEYYNMFKVQGKYYQEGEINE